MAVTLAGAVWLASLSSWAQDAPTAGDEAPPSVEVATVEAALAKMESDVAIENAVKDLLRNKYQEAIQEAKEAGAHAARTAAYREAIASGPGKVADLNAQREALPPVESAAKVTVDGDAEEFQEEYESRRLALAAMEEDLLKVESDLKRLEERPVEIRVRLPEAQRELAGVREQPKSPDLAGEPDSPGRAAEEMLREAREARLVGELEMLMQEQLSESVREDLLQARQKLLTRQVENGEALVEALGQEVNKRLSSEAKELAAQVGQTPPEVAADPSVAGPDSGPGAGLPPSLRGPPRIRPASGITRPSLGSRHHLV